jgi:hypothetical protein
MQRYVLGVTKLYKDHKGAISWHVHVEKVFVTCVVSLGNLIIKIILNVIYLKRRKNRIKRDRNGLYKN